MCVHKEKFEIHYYCAMLEPERYHIISVVRGSKKKELGYTEWESTIDTVWKMQQRWVTKYDAGECELRSAIFPDFNYMGFTDGIAFTCKRRIQPICNALDELKIHYVVEEVGLTVDEVMKRFDHMRCSIYSNCYPSK